MEALNILREPVQLGLPKKRTMKENVATANAVLESIFTQLDEIEMNIIRKTTPLEKKYIGLENLITEYVEVFEKYNGDKLRKRKGFPIIKRIKALIKEFHNSITPSETHLFYCLMTETELLIAKYADIKAGLPRKMVKKLKAAEEDICLIEDELEKLTRVISEDFKDCILPDNGAIEKAKDLVNRMSGFSMRAVYHNDKLYNYDNCQEALSNEISRHSEELEEIVFKPLSRESQYNLDIQTRIKAMRNLLGSENMRYPNKLKSEAKGILTRLEKFVGYIQLNIKECSKKELERELGEHAEFIILSCKLERIEFSLNTQEVWGSYFESLKNMPQAELNNEINWLKEITRRPI